MHIERLFSVGSLRPQDFMRFVIAGAPDDLPSPRLSVPDDWSFEAAEAFRPALCLNVPATRRVVEENTLPSWLWQHRAQGDVTKAEESILDVFERIAGAAAYRGWKSGLWDDEVAASTFYDEVCAMLLSRRLVIAPLDMAKLGLDWAYGFAADLPENMKNKAEADATLILQNETVDTLLRRSHPLAQNKWQSFLKHSLDKPSTHIAFVDTMHQWNAPASNEAAPRAVLNLMAFRFADGTLDLGGLEHATKLATLLLELHYDTLAGQRDKTRALALGLGNLASLLMALALPYNSDQARGTAAALAALVTATATATSAQIAARLGSFDGFAQKREGTLRSLRNMLRATFDEKNDYEHLAVLPQTIALESGVDLVVLSKARYAFEEAVRLTQEHGLRHHHLTALYDAPELAPLLDSSTRGIEPEATLTCDYALGGDQYQRRARPALLFALDKLGYDEHDRRAILDHVIGYQTLMAAPAISFADLREKGFDDATLGRIGAILPFVDHLRFAFTPWVLGQDFCRKTLGLSDEQLADPHLDILRHIGFSSKEIVIANAFCCGHRSVKGVLEMAEKDLGVFELRDDIEASAQLAMAGAVQSFMMGDVGLRLSVPASLSADLRGEMIIKAWEMGLRSLSLDLQAPYRMPSVATQSETFAIKRKTPSLRAGNVVEKPSATHAVKPKAPSRAISLKAQGSKHAGRSKRG